MASDCSSIEVQRLEEMEEAKQWRFHKSPSWIPNISNTAYKPQVVSLGPYHCENPNLKPMERHKDRAVMQFLKRSRLNYNDCLRSLSVIERKLMDGYDELDSKLQQNSNAFLNLMIHDGIFMLEIFGDGKKWHSGYDDDDPIFSMHGDLYTIPLIKRDMLMFENQIPMKVLHTLYRLQPEATGEDANKVVFQFFFPDMDPRLAPTHSLHILDMYRKVLLGPYPPIRPKPEERGSRIGNVYINRSAVYLDEAGIKFKSNEDIFIGGISFKNCVLRLPVIPINDMTEPILRNLVEYERNHYGVGNGVTGFVIFMDSIIDNISDIRLLDEKNIIQNALGSDQQAVALFKSLSKDISLDINSPFREIIRDVNTYCKLKRHKYRAALYHSYFTSPWAIICVLAAVLLFALIVTQTVYSIMDFHKNS